MRQTVDRKNKEPICEWATWEKTEGEQQSILANFLSNKTITQTSWPQCPLKPDPAPNMPRAPWLCVKMRASYPHVQLWALSTLGSSVSNVKKNTGPNHVLMVMVTDGKHSNYLVIKFVENSVDISKGL